MTQKIETVAALFAQEEARAAAQLTTWLLLGRRSGTWGRGATLEEAMAENKRAGGHAREAVAYRYTHPADTEVSVDSYGGILTRATKPGVMVEHPATVCERIEFGKTGKPKKR